MSNHSTHDGLRRLALAENVTIRHQINAARAHAGAVTFHASGDTAHAIAMQRDAAYHARQAVLRLTRIIHGETRKL